MLVVSLDSAVNVALPAMAEAFAIGPAEIRWVIICYVLTYAITSVAAGVIMAHMTGGIAAKRI